MVAFFFVSPIGYDENDFIEEFSELKMLPKKENLFNRIIFFFLR